MSDATAPKAPAFIKRKVGGIPVIYLIGGFVAVMAVIAWNMKPSEDVAESDELDAVDAESDGAVPSGSGVPPVPSGTVIVAPSQPTPEDAPYEDNSTWLRKSVAFLISKGKNPGDAQLALQHYLSGASLSYQEGELRDMAVREYGLPPDGFDAGPTAPKPATVPAPSNSGQYVKYVRYIGGDGTVFGVTPTGQHVALTRAMYEAIGKPKYTDIKKPSTAAPAPAKVVSPIKSVPKPTPPPKRYHVVRSGENLTTIGRKYGRSWQTIYNANKGVIGSNPNLIKPNQRLVIP